MIVNADYFSLEYNLRYYFLKFLPKAFYNRVLEQDYEKYFGRKPDLNKPQRLSEKILQSILYDTNPLRTILSDKLAAKNFVNKLLPELKTAKVYQVCSSFDEIDFSKCPKSFVIKTNHAWKSHILITNKNKIPQKQYEAYSKYYKKVLSINYAYWGTLELQYKNIIPKIFIEEYLGSGDEDSNICEYEVYCFKGKPEFINYIISPTGSPQFDLNKKNLTESQVFDTNWNKTDFKIRYKECDISAPDSFNKKFVLNYAEKLAQGFDFVRIDFFEFDNILYFGEFTFTPYSGFINFFPEKYDLFYGRKC